MALLRTQKRIKQSDAQGNGGRTPPTVLPDRNSGLGAAWLIGLLPLVLLISCGTTIGSASPGLTGATSKYSIQLSWVAPGGSDPAASYNVYRKVTGGTAGFEQVNTSPVLQVTYTDRAVQLGVSYTYEVRAVDADGGESEPSNIATFTIPSN